MHELFSRSKKNRDQQPTSRRRPIRRRLGQLALAGTLLGSAVVGYAVLNANPNQCALSEKVELIGKDIKTSYYDWVRGMRPLSDAEHLNNVETHRRIEYLRAVKAC